MALCDLRIAFGDREVVHIDSLNLGAGEILGLAGESGSGKSMTALAITGLASTVGATVTGSITLDGLELVGLPQSELRDIRGRRIAMIFQSPVSAFNPVFRVGDLMVRALRLHTGSSKAGAVDAARKALQRVLLSPEMLRRYPHQLSGGQAQRVAIGLALALHAEVLLADEPTSALDVTVQAEVLEFLRRLRDDEGMSVLFISHDLAVLSELCDRIVVMREGRVVEEGPVAAVLADPGEDYTRELVAAVPKIGRGAAYP
jgi:peptide/nickel transport system ATP-binding protein